MIDNSTPDRNPIPDFHEHRKRLKERYDRSGLAGFADHEVLEFLLFYVIPRQDTKSRAKNLLKTFGDLENVFSAKKEELAKIKGIGHEAARFFHLIREVSQLALKKRAYGKTAVISSASDLVAYLSGVMANLPEEQFRVVFLDHANAIIKDEPLSTGVEEQTAVYPRQVVKRALALNATGIIVAHNHPTGQLKPSHADREITRALIEASRALDLRLLDHIILGREGKGYFSFRENSLIS